MNNELKNNLTIGDRVKYGKWSGVVKDILVKGELPVCQVNIDGINATFNFRPTSLTKLDGAVLDISLSDDGK